MGALRDQDDDDRRPDSFDGDEAALRDLIQEIRAATPLSAAEERTLLERAAVGDKGSQDRLVAAYLDLVIRLAAARGEQPLSVPDLVQEGSIGLVEAVRSFASSGDSDFQLFAERLVDEKIDAAIAAEAASVRDAGLLIAAATDYERTDLVMRRELGREATEAELAEKLEWTVERTRYVAHVVADARRRHDEELLAFIDPAAIDFDDDERAEFDS
ncbi:MAG TPA: sigma factor [Verrucomicrobiae bacterium]|jgi:DNA-directed RNA polymerase sigma subunit (sigma70/sigma32)|nr:sigma factor [Verrucomicrobiae bacterium]